MWWKGAPRSSVRGAESGTARRSCARYLIVVAALTSLVGCTSQQTTHISPTPTVTGPAQSGLVVDPLEVDHSAWVSSLPPPVDATLLTSAEAQTQLSLPWKFVEFGTIRSRIEVAYVAGDGQCTLPLGFYVTQIAGGVAVAAVSKDTTSTTCNDKAVVKRAWIDLPELIDGAARLVHAPVDPTWNAPGYFD
jgi:hypothetical protein